MANIELNKKATRPKSILVTSSEYGVGITYVVSNLAIRYAKIEKKVLIIDSNLKSGIEDKIFNVDNNVGLANILALDNILAEDVENVVKETPMNNIYILSCGNTKINDEVFVSKKIEKIIELLKRKFDVIIIDSEPIAKQITSYGWASVADSTIIVAEYSKLR